MSRPARIPEARIAASLGPSSGNIRMVGWLAALMMVLVFAAFVIKLFGDADAPGSGSESIQIDFTAFWAAARLALAGTPLDAFDPAALRNASLLPPGTPPGDLLWLYPPGWLVAVIPLGLLPFPVAWLVYGAATFAAYLVAVRPFAAPLPGGALLVLAAPPVMMSLILGNNSLLWTAGLLGAFRALGQGRAVLAGGLIALLTLKPQLGILIPIALAAGGCWRAFLWAAVFSVALAALSTAVMGLVYWEHFLSALRLMSDLMQTDVVRFELMLSGYALVRLAGAGHEAAMAVQILATAACACAVAWVWRRPATPDLRAAALCAAIPLATPYAYHYEMTLALAAAMFLVRDGFGASRRQCLLLLALWFGPVPGLVFYGLVPAAVFAVPLLAGTLGICVWRAGRAPT